MGTLSKNEFGTILKKIKKLSEECVEESGSACPCAKEIESFLSQDSDQIRYSHLYEVLSRSKACQKKDEICEASRKIFTLTESAAQEFVKGMRE